jgi:hypothetical protein
MAGKLAFYKGKLMTGEEIAKLQAAEGGVPQTPLPPRPMVSEAAHAQPLPQQMQRQQYAPQQQMPMPPQAPQVDYEAIKLEMEARMRAQEEAEYAAAQQEAQAQQPVQGSLVTVYLRDSLKLDVEVDASSLRRFIEEINEAIGSQMPFQVGSKTINGRQILFYHVQ